MGGWYGGPQRQCTIVYFITAIYILVHKHIHRLFEYILQYNKIHLCKSSTICTCLPVQEYKFQYKNKSFGTEIFFKKIDKIGRYFIYDYYYVPKYMLIIVYLTKSYIFHYYKSSRLYIIIHPCIKP